MAFNLEVKYYNTFWLKQASTPYLINSNNSAGGYFSVFPGFSWAKGFDPIVYRNNNEAKKVLPNWPMLSFGYDPKAFKSNVYNVANPNYSKIIGSNWVIEESRIKGGFNNNQVDLGVRAYLREDSNLAKKRNNALIYSGIFNSNTNVNNTNVFSIAEDITKAVDPHNGSVQLIYAMDNNLTIFQENKVSTALIDKDYIYSAEGESISTQSNVVIGQVTPYTGEYGISRNPESFAMFGFRRYFADKDRSAILRLSRDGITEISNYGMKDFFRDKLSEVSEVGTEYVSSEYDVFPFSVLSLDFVVSPSQQTPNGQELGNYIILNSNIIADDSIVGCDIEINTDNTGFKTIEFTVSALGTINNNGTVKDVVFIIPKFNATQPSLVLNQGGDYPVIFAGSSTKIRFTHFRYDTIKGGFDNYKDNYLLSIQDYTGSKTDDDLSDSYNTLTFDETVQGWTTFYTYRPDVIFSLKNNLYTTKKNTVYRHYDENVSHNSFYGVSNGSSITFVFNGNPSISKNFKTISYEGSDGWQVESFTSDATDNSGVESRDTINTVKSYQEGVYTENGIPYRVGFNRKDNRYVANLINNSAASSEEINFGSSITGIKGFFATVRMSTDATTNAGGVKELFAVSTEFVVPSR